MTGWDARRAAICCASSHGELDVDEFERLVASAGAAAENGDYDAALSELTGALALWRGPAWGDLLDGEALEPDAQRLEELRLGALESRFEAELALGRGAELAPELERLVDEHPLRERLLASLMLALYRAGRQTDALDVFQTARRRLVDELGLEPGPELHELQRRILEHDPDARSATPAPATFWPGSRAIARSGRAWGLAALIVGVLVLSAGATGRPPRLAPWRQRDRCGGCGIGQARERDTARGESGLGDSRRRFGVGGGSRGGAGLPGRSRIGLGDRQDPCGR